MIKAYTDIEQSKKLAEILPLKSADMSWKHYVSDFVSEGYGISLDTIEYNTDIPCWSLAVLLGALPTTIGNFFEKNALRLRMDKGENDFNIWYENFDCGDVAEGLDVIEDNPIDACVEMIVKLHDQKLL